MTDNTNIPARTLLAADGQTDGNGDYRAIAMVIDTSFPAGEQLRTTQSVLDPLTPVGLAELRAEVHAAKAAGTPRFLCAVCQRPVHLAQRPAGPGVTRNGLAAFFRHVADTDAPPCPCRTVPGVHNVGAVQFAGLQEGLDHHTLKHALADCLCHDPRFSDVQVEKRLSADGSWRVPDVCALFEGKQIAFDLQLATLPISTIRERENHYAAMGVHHVWLTGAADLSRLSHQGFCDLHLNMAGRIFAIDDTSIGRSLRDGQFQLQELSILPRLVKDRPIHNIWETAPVGTGVIMMAPNLRKAEGERRYRRELAAQVSASLGAERQAICRAAAMNQGLAPVGLQWTRLARFICGPGIDGSITSDVGKVLAFLAQVEVFVTHQSGSRPSIERELQRRLGTLLAGRHALHWAPLVLMVFSTLPSIKAAVDPTTMARLNTLLTSTGKVRPLLRMHAGMIAALYPWLGRRLLMKAPRFGPKMRLPASRA
ncbi:competence protein CoiA family protein [Devosia beringensis]|uniref:competence protein CoiA family protein n=1 Tax=Devosia beringensis TaxID=2657486 RepID=UPI00186B9431|nr:hypothetical protein [Devosia beringensis]